jgi:glycosyltransferase involved in cell wall biosynthesis
VEKAGEASGKVINYMGAGLPVVCFEGKNNRRFLGEGGIYATDDKIENLSAKMVWAIENPDKAKKLGQLNKKRVEEVFSWNNSIKDTVEAFEKLTSKNSRYNKSIEGFNKSTWGSTKKGSRRIY